MLVQSTMSSSNSPPPTHPQPPQPSTLSPPSDNDTLAVPTPSHRQRAMDNEANAAAASSSSSSSGEPSSSSGSSGLANPFASLSLTSYNGTCPAPSPSPANSPVAPYDMTPMSFKKHKIEVLNAGSIKRKHQRILVTGGAGFIGSHLIERLMRDDNNLVICVDNLFSGNKSNIQMWLNHPRFEFIRHDVTTELQLEVDQIYHLACPASPVFYQNNGIRTIKTSVLGTLNMLGLAKRLNARILFTSTSEVYGDPDVHPQVEEYNGNVNPIGIRSCFAEDTRVMTDKGFKFLSEIETMLAGGAAVQYACFDVASQSIVYRDGQLVLPPNERKKLVSFTSPSEQARWDDASRAVHVDRQAPSDLGLSIQVTADHTMFVQQGDADPKHASMLKATAQALLDDNLPVRFLCHAENGVGLTSDGKIEELLLSKLGLATAQVEAWLHFYGYWLGAGSLDFGAAGLQSVVVSPRQAQEVKYVQEALDELGLVNGTDYKQYDLKHNEVRTEIIDSKWIAFFNEEYAAKNLHNANGDHTTAAELVDSDKWLLSAYPSLCRDHSRAVIEGLRRSNGSDTILASCETLRDQLMVLAMHAGHTAFYECAFEKGAVRGYRSKQAASHSLFSEEEIQGQTDDFAPVTAVADQWRICLASSESRTAMASVSGASMREVAYDGRVWCVTVDHPDHLIIAQRTQVDKSGVAYRSSRPVIVGNCYDEGKRLAESLCFEYYRQHNVAIRIGRLFNTYGPRMIENDGRVVSNFIVQALSKKPITIYGDGSQTRSFCYVDDMVDGLIRLMNGDYIGPVNLGNPEEYTITQLAEQVQALIDPSASVVYEPVPSDDPRKRRPDITKAQMYLDGWTPKVPLKEGLKKTIRDFSRRQKAGDF